MSAVAPVECATFTCDNPLAESVSRAHCMSQSNDSSVSSKNARMIASRMTSTLAPEVGARTLGSPPPPPLAFFDV